MKGSKFEVGDVFIPKEHTEDGYRRRITDIRFKPGNLSETGFFIYGYEYAFLAYDKEWEKSNNEIEEDALIRFYTKAN